MRTTPLSGSADRNDRRGCPGSKPRGLSVAPCAAEYRLFIASTQEQQQQCYMFTEQARDIRKYLRCIVHLCIPCADISRTGMVGLVGEPVWVCAPFLRHTQTHTVAHVQITAPITSNAPPSRSTVTCNGKRETQEHMHARTSKTIARIDVLESGPTGNRTRIAGRRGRDLPFLKAEDQRVAHRQNPTY